MQMVELFTKRTSIRPLALSDINQIILLHTDAQTKKYAWVDHLQTVDSILQWYDEQQQLYAIGLGILAITDSQNLHFIGLCGLRPIPNQKEALEIAYRIVPEQRMNGYATEAANCIINYAFKTLKYKTIFAHVHKENSPGMSVVKRLGFDFVQREGIWRLHKKTA